MASQLTDLIRKKYPGQYDDMDDVTLEKAILTKYPDYKDLVIPLEEPTPIPAQEPIQQPIVPTPEEIPTVPIQEPIQEPEPEQGWLSKAWSAVSEPLTTAPSRFASSIADYIDEPTLAGSPTGEGGIGDYFRGLGARTRGFVSGATEGIGDLVSGLTSPINLATAALTGGQGATAKRGLDTISDMLGYGAKGFGALTAGHGAGEVLDPESTMAERGFGLAEIAGGLSPFGAKPKPSVTSEIVGDSGTTRITAPEGALSKPKTVTPKTADTIPTGTIVTIKAGKDTPDKVKQAMASGFEFESVDDAGNFRFKKTKEATGIEPTRPKILTKQETLLNQEQLDPKIPILERKVKEPKKLSTLQQAYDLPRGLMSVDLPFMTSAAFRQASPLAWTNDWFKAWGKAASGFKSDDAFETIMTNIKNNKYAKPKYEPLFNKEGVVKSYREKPSFVEEAGLSLTDLGKISNREEVLRSQWAEKIPGYGRYVKSSNRAYTAFLNDLRMNKFTQMVEEAKRNGQNPETNLVLGRQIADFVNAATGRGKLEIGIGTKNINLEQSSKLLTNALFSPRLMASRTRFLNPSTYIQAEPQVRKEYIKGLARSIGTWWGLAGLAELAGAQVSKDPNNADFGKIRIDNTRIDPGAGFQQYLVLLSRQGTGKFTSSTSGKISDLGSPKGPYGQTYGTVAGQFALNKLHPMARLAYDIMNVGKDQPIGLGDRAMQMALPMFTQDLMEAAQEDPELAAIMGPLGSIGFGTQTYEPGSFGKPTFIPSEYDVQIGGR